MKMPSWLVRLLPCHRQSQAARHVLEENYKATRKLTRAVDQVFIDHPDAVSYLVHRSMDYRRQTRKPWEIG